MNLETELKSKLRKARRSGKSRLLATCPVHKGGKERNPSFSVNFYTGHYRCFSCGISGSLDDLRRIIGLDGSIQASEEILDESQTNENIDEAVLAIYRECPLGLLESGFSEYILQEHEVGYDDLFDRITFPIRNREGDLVAISGRAREDAEPRYKVYTHRMLRGAADEFYAPKPKSHLYSAERIARPVGNVFVVEGFKACLWLRQHGIQETIATTGGWVSPEQIGILRTLAERVTIAFDRDQAGINYARDICGRLLKAGVPTRILDYPAKQPDQLDLKQIQSLFT